MREKIRRDDMLIASNVPASAPMLFDSKSILELMRPGRYICRYSMPADNSMPKHNASIALIGAPKRARNIKPASRPNGR